MNHWKGLRLSLLLLSFSVQDFWGKTYFSKNSCHTTHPALELNLGSQKHMSRDQSNFLALISRTL